MNIVCISVIFNYLRLKTTKKAKAVNRAGCTFSSMTYSECQADDSPDSLAVGRSFLIAHRVTSKHLPGYVIGCTFHFAMTYSFPDESVKTILLDVPFILP